MLKIQPRIERSTRMSWISPLIAILLTLLASCLLFLALNISPMAAFKVFILSPFSDSYNIGELMVKTTPLLLCATGLTLCYRANIWNIGAEGQLLIGALASSAVAVHVAADAGTTELMIVLITGACAGMAWAAIPTLLYQRFNTNIILSTIMVNYIGYYLLQWAVYGPLMDPNGMGFPESAMFPDGVLLEPLETTINSFFSFFSHADVNIIQTGRATDSIAVALLMAVLTNIILYRSLPGFKLRVFGEDKAAARYAGFNSNRIVWGVMLFAGALAGFAGASEVTGPIGQLIPQVSPGYGYAAIIVAYLGRLNPIGVIISAFFMGALYMGSDMAQIELGISTAVTGLFQGTLLFFLLACDYLINYEIVFKRNTTDTTQSNEA